MANEPVQRRLQFVLEHYGIRPNQNIILNYFSMANEVFTITSDTGKYVLKHCFKNNTLELVENEAALIRHLNEQGVPSPKLVSTKQGQNALHYDGDFFVMTEFMEGFIPNWEQPITLSMIQETTKALADFHGATESFKAPHADSRIGSFDIEQARQWLINLKTELALCDDATRKSRKSITEIEEIIDWMLTLSEEADADLNELNLTQLKKQWIHGDMHQFNLIFSEDQSHYTGILDFDFMRHDYRLFDIYWCSRVYNYSFWFKEAYGDQIEEEDFEPPEQEMIDIMVKNLYMMLQQYHRYNPLTKEELKALPLMVKALPLWVVRFFSLNNSEEECLEHCDWYRWKRKSLPMTLKAVEAATAKFIDQNNI
jgi:Ser/Thr protein kinase RdoA (MazF antagonist)